MCELWDFYSHLLNHFFFKLSIFSFPYNYKEARNIIFLLRKRNFFFWNYLYFKKIKYFRLRKFKRHFGIFRDYIIITFLRSSSDFLGVTERRNGGFEIGIRNPLSRWAEARKCRSTLRTISNSFCEWSSMLSEQTWHIYLCSSSKMRGT